MIKNKPQLEIKTLIEKSNNCVIIPHKNPDGDALGSSLALNLFLKKKGLDSIVITPNDYPKFLKWMPGEKHILNFEINNSIASEYLKKAELIFVLDFNDPKRGGDLSNHIENSYSKTIMIDHHENPKDFSLVNFSLPKYSSTSEMVYDLINFIDSSLIDDKIATCLYTGIMTDTGSFKYSSTTPKTHYVIGKLIENGANNSKIHQNVYDTFSFNRIKLLGIALKNIIKLDFGPFVIITLNSRELEECSYKKGDSEGFVNYGLAINGIELSVILIENIDEEIVKISFRSKGSFPVNIFAEKYFNGGGHHNAAGGISYDSLENTKNKITYSLKSFVYE